MAKNKIQDKTQKRVSKITRFFKEKKKVILVMFFLVVAIFAYVIQGKYHEANPSTEYKIVYAGVQNLVKTISISGEVVPESEVELAPDTSGQIVEIYVRIGQKVSKGQILAKVDSSAQRAQLTQSLGSLQAAEARVESSKASLAKIESGTREEQLRILDSNLQGAKNDYESTLHSARNTLTNTYAVVNQSIIHGTDVLFYNPSRYNPKIDFTVSDSDLRNRLSAVRVDIRHILDRHEDVQVATMESDALDTELELLISELGIINNFYRDLFTAIDSAVISNEVEARYVNIVTPARNAILGQISTITTMSNTVSQKNNKINIAQANLDQAISGAQKEDVDVAKVGVDSARASVLSAGGSYQAAKVALEKTYVRSPQSGIVVDLYKEVGEFVSSSVKVVKVSSVSKYVSALVSEVDISKVKVGMNVAIKLDAFADKQFTGTIDFIYPDKQEVMGIVYYELKVRFIEDEIASLTILPGMSLDVVIPYKTKEGVLAVERGIAKKDGGKYFVQILNPNKKKPIDKKFANKFFEAGFVGDKYIEVLSGLNENVNLVKFTIKDGSGAGKKQK